MKPQLSITSIPGLRVGHAQDYEALTGVTVVLCEAGAAAGIDVRGGASGTRGTDSLRPMHLVEQVHGVVLSGGSAFGLDAAGGVVRYLEERGVGFDVRVARVPIVPAAILFDLGIGQTTVRPDAAMAYQACLNASADPPVEGNVGAGTGCTVGKLLGISQAMKSGIGSAAVKIGSGIIVGAIMAVNVFGDVVDPQSGRILAGARSNQPESRDFADSLQVMKTLGGRSLRFARRENTAIGVVATNASLNREQMNKVAQMAQDGLARTVRPAHTMLDGDSIFAISLGNRRADVNVIGAFAAEVVAQAIVRAVQMAKPLAGLPAFSDR